MSLKSYVRRCVRAVIGKPDVQITANIVTTSPLNMLKARKIIVTGGGHGLGKAMAKKFVDEGANVLIAGRNEDKLIQTSKELGCLYLLLDVTKMDSFKQFISEAKDLLGGLDTLVNNAGVSCHETTFLDVTPESYSVQFSTNLEGPYFLTKSFIEDLLSENRTGYLLFISSETGETTDYRPYGLTKAAVNSLVRGLANYYANKGIRVNAIAPGVTASSMSGFSSEGNLYCSSNINERVYLPEEVAELACFLLSDAAGCISGQVITCNNAKTVNPRWK